MPRIWLIRHGASTAAAGLAIGVTDPGLSDEGRGQSLRAAAELRGRPISRVLSSDLRRALETAAIIAAPHGLEVEPARELREIDFGVWEGRSLSDLWVDEPAAARIWEADVRVTPSSFGESVGDLESRIGRFWDSLQRLPRDSEIAVVAHGGSLAALRSLITGTPFADCLESGIQTGGVLPVEAEWRSD